MSKYPLYSYYDTVSVLSFSVLELTSHLSDIHSFQQILDTWYLILDTDTWWNTRQHTRERGSRRPSADTVGRRWQMFFLVVQNSVDLRILYLFIRLSIANWKIMNWFTRGRNLLSVLIVITGRLITITSRLITIDISSSPPKNDLRCIQRSNLRIHMRGVHKKELPRWLFLCIKINTYIRVIFFDKEAPADDNLLHILSQFLIILFRKVGSWAKALRGSLHGWNSWQRRPLRPQVTVRLIFSPCFNFFQIGHPPEIRGGTLTWN